MAKCGYRVVTAGTVALTAATAQTAIGIKGGSANGIDLTLARFAFDGVTASAVPVLVELCYNTWATNPPGTNSTAITSGIVQSYGRVIATEVIAGKHWTVEPTALSVLDEQLITPAGGLEIYDFPLGTSFDSAVSNGFSIRFTAPAAVNVRCTLGWERC